jgi:hypothetical protein
LPGSVDKRAQWTAFLKNAGVAGPDSFMDLLDSPGLFLSPMLDAIESREVLEGNWPASGTWALKW